MQIKEILDNDFWIHVNTRMPEKGDYCWVYTKSGKIVMDIFDGDYWVNQVYDSITHWMPIIEPPIPKD